MYRDIKIFSGSAHPELAKAICSHIGLPLGRSSVIRFSNENMLVQIEENVREADVFVVQPSCSPVSDGIIALLMTIDALKHASAQRITAVIPYFPYARSDKKLSATHFDYGPAGGATCYKRLAGQPGTHHGPPFARGPGVFSYPGGPTTRRADYLRLSRRQQRSARLCLSCRGYRRSQRGETYAHRLHLPVAIRDKRRYGDDESPRAVNLMGEVEGKTALIVDNKIASAGTVIEAARFLAEKKAAAIEAAAVHGILSGRAIERLVQSSIRSILVTDSVPIAPAKRIDKLTVLSVAPLFAAGIKAIHDGDSVSALFR